MNERRLGTQGLVVSGIGLGCMGSTHAPGTPYYAEFAMMIDHALELGCNFFDTADVYGPHVGEELLGRCLQGRRAGAVIATHVGQVFDLRSPHRAGGGPARIRFEVDAALRRLRTDRIDLLYQHRVDPTVPVEEIAGVVRELIGEGKVLHFGLSEAGTDAIRRAHRVQPVSAVRGDYSLWERDIEGGVLPLLFDLGIGMVARRPLGRGFPGGRVADGVRSIADARDVMPAQIALAWVLGVNRRIVPIPDARQRHQLERHFATETLQLTDAETAWLDDVSTVQCARGGHHDERHAAPLAHC